MHAVATIEEAMYGADAICLCTSSATPVISGEWLVPNARVTSVGYSPPGGELDLTIVVTRLAFDPPPARGGEPSGLDSDAQQGAFMGVAAYPS